MARNQRLKEKDMKAACITIALVSLWSAGVAWGEVVPVKAGKHPGAVPAFTRGHVRFQVLAPALVRLEYSPSGAFVDAPSVAVINRDDWPQTQARAARKRAG